MAQVLSPLIVLLHNKGSPETFMACKPQVLWHTNPDSHAIRTPISIGDGGVLQYIELRLKLEHETRDAKAVDRPQGFYTWASLRSLRKSTI